MEKVRLESGSGYRYVPSECEAEEIYAKSVSRKTLSVISF